ncbi:hypothetical protein Leryth_008465 [Lithospermum erythrorhizon]|nr:hypothetical protein Leryth_008465 [Lithospermum erythrorhizon]
MVGSSHRSPSPLTSRSIPNLPISLEPHQSQPIRKSFNGTNNFNRPSNLTNSRKFSSSTPANSPAEIGGRNYVGGEEKENEKAQFLKASAKLRSPSNKSKNFMAPTISAAIKFTPSPRKKILVDRNDPVRTSITLSDGKATFFSSVSSDVDKNHDVFCSEEKNNEVVQEVPIVPKPLKKVTFKEVKWNTNSLAESCIEKVPIFSNSEDIIDNSLLELPNISLSCPPHEPEDNILSGAKFDVGKVNFEGSDSDEIKQLEDSCMCELSENLPFSEVFEESQTVDSWERLEDVSESLPLSTPTGDAIIEDSIVPKEAMKPHPLGNWKSVCLVLVLLGTFMLSVTNFTTMHSFVPKDFNFELPELSEVAEIAKVNVDEFGGKVKQWSADSISYLYKMVLPVLEVDKMGPLQFMNLTVLEDDYRLSSFFDVNSKGKEFEEYMGLELEDVEEEDEMEEVDDAMKEGEHETEEVEDEIEEVEHETEEVEDEIEEVEDERKEAEALDIELKMDTSEDDQLLAEIEKSHVEQEIVSSVATRKLINQQSSLDMVSIPESPDMTHVKVDASEIDHNSPSSETEIQFEEHQSCSSLESRKLEGDHESFSDVSYTHESSQIPIGSESSSGESRIQANIVILGASLGLLGLGTVALIIYINQRRKMVSMYGDTNPICNKIEFKPPKEPSNEEVVGESCSSSYQRKSESFVYSGEYSFGSPSYGSFTTYETIPIKHAGRDEEIVTPVRRSSRIRKQVTSQ